MATHRTTTVVELPKPPSAAEDDADWTELAQKFRNLRLRSLKTSPEAFASTYEAESQRGLGQTFDRLRNSKARQFVAVENDDGNQDCSPDAQEIVSICNCEWIGMIVLIGPMEGSFSAEADPIKSAVRGCGNDTSTPTEVSKSTTSPPVEFVLNGVFVEPSARGRGFGKALMEAAVDHARSHGSSASAEKFITVLVNGENVEARKLYEKAGFRRVGEGSYTQQPRSLLGEVHAAAKVALKMRLDLA